MPTKIVSTFQAALEDAKKNFIKAGINTVNIVAANARKNAQANITSNFTTRNNFTVNSVRFTQCKRVNRLADIKSETGITERAGYMARQETGGTRRSNTGANLIIPTTTARGGSNAQKVRQKYYWSSVKPKLVTSKRRGSRKASLVARASIAAKTGGFVRSKDIIFKVSNFRFMRGAPKFKLTPILNLKHRTTQTPQTEWLAPASETAAKDMQAIFNSQMEKM